MIFRRSFVLLLVIEGNHGNQKHDGNAKIIQSRSTWKKKLKHRQKNNNDQISLIKNYQLLERSTHRFFKPMPLLYVGDSGYPQLPFIYYL